MPPFLVPSPTPLLSTPPCLEAERASDMPFPAKVNQGPMCDDHSWFLPSPRWRWPHNSGWRPQAKPAFPQGGKEGRTVYPLAPSWPCAQIILCPLVLDPLLSWMHPSSLAGAPMCDYLTAASCPRDPGLQGAWERDKKGSFI